MRYQGKVKVWKDDKGFGFVLPDGGGPQVFLHISAFTRRRKPPEVGDFVSYELLIEGARRPKAINVRFIGEAELAMTRTFSRPPIMLIGVLALSLVGYIAYIRLSHPNTTVPASVYKAFFVRSAVNNQDSFQCTPAKTSCSQMTSCSEAFFYQERCGVPNMDGDRDGIPCEQQWCN